MVIFWPTARRTVFCARWLTNTGPAARGRHLQVWSPQEAEQRLFERIDADSALDITRGQDGFEVAQHNAGNNKLDAYLRREIDYTATVDPSNGQLTGTLRITLHNEVPLPLSALPVTAAYMRAVRLKK